MYLRLLLSSRYAPISLNKTFGSRGFPRLDECRFMLLALSSDTERKTNEKEENAKGLIDALFFTSMTIFDFVKNSKFSRDVPHGGPNKQR